MKKLSQYLNYAIVILVLGLGAIYFFESKKTTSDRKVAAAAEIKKPVNVEEVVNKYMKQTSDQMFRDQVKSQAAIREQLIRQQLDRSAIAKKETKAEVKPEDVPADQQIWKNSQLKNESVQNYQSPSAESLKQQEELEKKEFARQYIENARKDGYHVILSPDLKVLSVTPIRQPSQSNDSAESFPAD